MTKMAGEIQLIQTSPIKRKQTTIKKKGTLLLDPSSSSHIPQPKKKTIVNDSKIILARSIKKETIIKKQPTIKKKPSKNLSTDDEDYDERQADDEEDYVSLSSLNQSKKHQKHLKSA